MLLKRVLAMLIGMTITISSSSAADFSTIRRYVYPVIVSSDTTQIIASSGSGVVIRDGYVLTAAHLTPSKKQVIYVNSSGLKRATVVKVDKGSDLALIKADVKCPCAPISSVAKVPVDQTVYAVGFPMYLDYRIQVLTVGHAQGYVDLNLVSTTATAPGGSGGGLFTREGSTYRLVGLVKGVAVIDIGPPYVQVGQLQNWFVISTSSATILEFLKGTEAAM